MNKHGRYLILLLMCTVALSGCLGSIWTGASLVYDRHNVYRKLDDYSLSVNAGHALFYDRLYQHVECTLDLAVFNGDILLAGHVPTQELRTEAIRRLEKLPYRRFFMQVAVNKKESDGIEDTWITTKIRSQIVADADIDPNQFKIITVDNIAYVMGDVKPSEAKKVINIARSTKGVIRVVTLLKYYNLSLHPAPAG